MKKSILFAALFVLVQCGVQAQEKPGNIVFWETLSKHCGKAYEGEVTTPISDTDPFAGKRLVMHLVNCGDEFIHIPFFVGDDKSRTWVLTHGKWPVQT